MVDLNPYKTTSNKKEKHQKAKPKQYT